MELIVFTGLLLASASAKHLDELLRTFPGQHHLIAVFGGTMVKITEVPFMALFRLKNRQWGCGASIVHRRFLVTAAHCKRQPICLSDLRVTIGTDNVNRGIDVNIENIFVHPNFGKSHNEMDYDLAVIKLKRNLKFDDRVNLIEMADSYSVAPKPGDLLETYGFGLTERKKMSFELLRVKVPFVDLPTCSKLIKIKNYNVTDRMLCAGGQLGKDSCRHDSGGPLVYKGRLIGVVSWGQGCGVEGRPGVYASVPSMRNFIRKTIKNNYY